MLTNRGKGEKERRYLRSHFQTRGIQDIPENVESIERSPSAKFVVFATKERVTTKGLQMHLQPLPAGGMKDDARCPFPFRSKRKELGRKENKRESRKENTSRHERRAGKRKGESGRCARNKECRNAAECRWRPSRETRKKASTI